MKSDSESHAVVEIDADLLLHARLITDDLAGRHAANRNLALAGAQILDGEAGDVARKVLDRVGAGPLDVLLRLSVDRERHVQQRGLAQGRGDDDLGLLGDGRGRILREGGRGRAEREDGNGAEGGDAERTSVPL